MEKTIQLPYKHTPRDYQIPLWTYVRGGGKRAVVCMHRRAGKDLMAWNITIEQAIRQKGVYYYCLPTYSQGRKVIWEGITGNEGLRFLDHIPKEAVESMNEQEMRINLVNGSIIRVTGSDQYDRLVGTNPIGIVFSEYALANPLAWEYLRPILTENDGWAIFVSTPRGQNHFHDQLEIAKKIPSWFWQLSTVDDTHAVSAEAIQEERLSGMHEEMLQQEFFCSFSAGMVGSYYADQLKDMEEQQRFCRVPYEPSLPVHTAWDLGMDDAMGIWFLQVYGKEIRFLSYEEHAGEGIQFYVNLLNEKPYKYGTHYFPHDIKVRELGTGRSRLESFQELGVTNYRIAPKLEIDDGIQAVRTLFPRFWMDSEGCKWALNALYSYRKEYDEKRKIFRSQPLHDWASTCADSLRAFAVGYDEEMPREKSRLRKMLRQLRDPYDEGA